MAEQKLQRQIPTPIITYETPFPKYPFEPEKIPKFSSKLAEELDKLIPIATRVGIPPYGSPVAKLDRYSGTDQTYQEVVKWRIEERTQGHLKEVSMVTDQYSKTHFQLRIGGKIFFEDKIIQAPLTLPFPETRLRSTAEVLLECKSTDGTSITVDGSITGREVPA